ncbi:Protein of unknown function [Gryllus bimaculatus]|nr:Protein of unknown function [Gryllus bimaculatus]
MTSLIFFRVNVPGSDNVFYRHFSFASLSKTHKMLQNTAHQFAVEELKPVSAKSDSEQLFPVEQEQEVMQTTSAKYVGDHWVLNGTKVWVTSGYERKVVLVFATVVNPEP